MYYYNHPGLLHYLLSFRLLRCPWLPSGFHLLLHSLSSFCLRLHLNLNLVIPWDLDGGKFKETVAIATPILIL